MIVSHIVAISKNNVIGNKGQLPWKLPDDLRRFKELTLGHDVIMGRKTMESILGYLNKPLPDRHNIVVTRQRDYSIPGATVAHSIDEALEKSSGGEVFIIGGSEIYNQSFPLTDRVYLTEVDIECEGDAYYPELSLVDWELKNSTRHDSDNRHKVSFDWKLYERKQ